MVLAVGDLPAGWRENVVNVGEERPSLSAAAIWLATSVDIDNLQRWGYEAGFGRRFDLADNQSEICSIAVKFSNIDGAKEAFSHKRGKVAAVASEVEVTQEIGDERAGFDMRLPYAPAGFTAWGIIFRKANVVAMIDCSGPGMFSLDNAVALAQVVEGRMQ
jgi:hypothetical protein